MSSASTDHLAGRTTAAILSGIMGVAAVGYFVGINDGVPREDRLPVAAAWSQRATVETRPTHASTTAVPAANYAEMRRSETGPTSRWRSKLDQIPQPQFDLFAEIKPNENDKKQSTLTRASRRAFNGAPPVIPHAVQNTSDAACYACHGQGMRIGDRVANRMSHAFLANCTQCHASPAPKPFQQIDASVNNSFVGLPAPLEGERAFPGAPPTIPHSTWMREQCLACHGNQAGWAGLEATHPWRVNCTQCHAPSALLEQAVVADSIRFVSPPVIEKP